MATGVESATWGPIKGQGRLGRLLSSLFFRTYDAALVPRGYAQIALPSDKGLALRSATGTDGLPVVIPVGAKTVVINVEGQPLRYCDTATTMPTYGELYPVGSTFSRTLQALGSISLCGTVPGAIANVSFYATEPD